MLINEGVRKARVCPPNTRPYEVVMTKPAQRTSDPLTNRDAAGSAEPNRPGVCALGHVARAPVAPSGQVPEVTRRVTLMPDVSAGVLELFRALIEAMPDAIVVVDDTSAIVLVNVQTERLFGYTREELLGNRIDILVP